MNRLNEFFELERKRVIEPDAYFAQRVMARLNEPVTQGFGIWNIVPSSTRPVLAIALVLIFCFIAAEIFIPQMPQRGMTELFLETEQNPAESFLYNDTDVPSRQVVMQQLIESEDQQ
jgi:hypothetical protein